MKADRNSVLRQLKTARGQIDGIIKMVEDGRYCIDISNQILATRAILSKVNRSIIDAHMRNCIIEAAMTATEQEREKKLDEIAGILKKMDK